MAANIKSGSSGDLADVNTNKELKVALAGTLDNAGYAVVAGENHDGSVGATKIRRPLRVSTDGRLRVGIDTLTWTDTFNHGIQDVSKYNQVASTMTIVPTGGVLSLNAGNSVASAAVARVQTWRPFSLLGSSALQISFRARFAVTPVSQNVCELGLGIATGVTDPTDGVFFRLTGVGALTGVVNYNGAERSVTLALTPASNQFYEFRIVLDQDRAEFYINDECMGVLTLATAPTLTLARALPILMRCYNAAAVGTAQRLEIADIVVCSRDLALGMSYYDALGAMGRNAIITPPGAASGGSANQTNSAAPASATLSNTAAGYTTLGGKFQFVAPAGAETDYALFGHQTPAIAPAGGNLGTLIKRIKIDVFNMGAPSATTPTLLEFSLGIGATAVSLATADSATAGTRAARRTHIGVLSIPVGAVVGQYIGTLELILDVPLLVEAGTFTHIILKVPVGTATASQIIRGAASVNAAYV